eukprot:TRINITY_DN6969_c0_g1_i1.p1 TRINITY_DN6969_c0_g1~~TRINITY_DN6969_c0_g1_i1.p1  ORF type:complete len:121 (+),score=35.19 TRINITY_DN6969_c0_g1_i1:105-467(+)
MNSTLCFLLLAMVYLATAVPLTADNYFEQVQKRLERSPAIPQKDGKPETIYYDPDTNQMRYKSDGRPFDAQSSVQAALLREYSSRVSKLGTSFGDFQASESFRAEGAPGRNPVELYGNQK